jgi:hypothetical protein
MGLADGVLRQQALQADELAQWIAAAVEPAGVAQARLIVSRPRENRLQESRGVRHGNSFRPQHPDASCNP